jgi:multicomponent Na+:H+ antiporter subunit D
MFNLFVWFEVMLISSFVLMSLGESKAALGGAFKYVLLNLISSTLFLTAIGLLYGKIGTLNFAHLALRIESLSLEPALYPAAVLLFCAFSIKAALFPVHFWLPASYHTAPPYICALFGGLLTKVGVYALIRVFTIVFPLQGTWLQPALVILSLTTMVIGVLGAISQMHTRRLLSFHIVSQIGYVTLGLALFTELSIAAAVIYLVHIMLAKTNLFLISGVAGRMTRSEYLDKQGGLYHDHLLLSICFLLSALALAGLPPLSGFFSKALILFAAMDSGAVVATIIAALVGLGTLFSMLKIWTEAFWKKRHACSPGNKENTESAENTEVIECVQPSCVTIVSIATLSLGSIAIAVWIEPIYRISREIAAELLGRKEYIDAVIGGVL